MLRPEIVRAEVSATEALRWSPALIEAIVEDLYVDDHFEEVFGRAGGTLRSGHSAGAASGRKAARSGHSATEMPYRTIGHTLIGGRLWLRIELLDRVCSDERPKVIDSGWVPAQSPVGDQWAWFWSRGC